MKQMTTLTKENLTDLLNWFSPNQDEAGKEYEQIREGLIRYFHFRGCSEPDILADETITRVAMKLSTFDTGNNVKTITYFYGFAKNIFREYLAQKARKEIDIESVKFLQTANFEDNENSFELECLENCLKELDFEEKDLLLQYYSKNKREKLELRQKLADEWKIKKGTLHTKVHRLKLEVRKCMKKCINEKNL
jgi:DNA-directed RNA polymerase specialized sigma24 family protein